MSQFTPEQEAELRLLLAATDYGARDADALTAARIESNNEMSLGDQLAFALGIESGAVGARFLTDATAQLIDAYELGAQANIKTEEGRAFCDMLVRIVGSGIITGALTERGMARAKADARRAPTRGTATRQGPSCGPPRARPSGGRR